MQVYPCEAKSVEGFVQRLALAYVQYGYLFYVAGSIPAHKDPAVTDRNIIERYDINISRWTRYRRSKHGFANVHYLRFGRFFVIIASKGKHCFLECENGRIRDIRECPVRFAGYSIGYKRSRGGQTWHPSVRIEERVEYRLLKKRFLADATSLTVEEFIRTFRALPFEPYAPVIQQELELLRQINERRAAAVFGACTADGAQICAPLGPSVWGVGARRKGVARERPEVVRIGP